jgi:hypothetical protein
LLKASEPNSGLAVSLHQAEDGMIRPIGEPVAWIFALAIAFAPAGALAEGVGGYVAPAAPKRAAHHRVHRPPAEARLGRPAFIPPPSPPPSANANLPTISRDPNDCVKTTCTCLAGGGC